MRVLRAVSVWFCDDAASLVPVQYVSTNACMCRCSLSLSVCIEYAWSK